LIPTQTKSEIALCQRKELQEYIKDMRKCVDEIHRKLETSVKSPRAAKRKNANKKRSAVPLRDKNSG
jgi:hypothetical protein